MNTARFNMLAYQLAPHRKITSADHRPDGVVCILACGHVHNGNPSFHYKIGTEVKCRACGQAEARHLPEFKGEL